ncbi:uncharacterized protein V1510DRAFT_400837 [Dipodascopsis tothii]|uniref:uncharacterized protein n=1 Tax=Dipodascopsis tothii TaxID=44089 RepID=UPI0034CD4D02
MSKRAKIALAERQQPAFLLRMRGLVPDGPTVDTKRTDPGLADEDDGEEEDVPIEVDGRTITRAQLERLQAGVSLDEQDRQDAAAKAAAEAAAARAEAERAAAERRAGAGHIGARAGARRSDKDKDKAKTGGAGGVTKPRKKKARQVALSFDEE